jgi:hypothetical protein
MIDPETPEPGPKRSRWHVVAVVALTIVMVALVELHVRGVNGPWYGVITWRRYPAVRAYPLMLLCAVPSLLAVVVWPRMRRFRAMLLLLPMLGAMAGKLVFAELRSEPGPHLVFISQAVQDRLAVSYYIDAVALSNFHGWLADFPSIMPMLNLHSKTKAPGNILFYMAFIKTLGHSDRTALIAGIVMGAIATLSIPACYWFLRVLVENEMVAFFGACFMGLCPGFVLFFPASDPAYPFLSCTIGACWILALKRDRIVWSIATGVIAAAILLISFNVLVFGLFLAAYALFVSGRPIATIAKHAGVALGVCVVLCGALWLTSGYDPIATFAYAWQNQHALLAEHAGDRPYPNTAWNDLLDFALGSGWISFLLAGFTIATTVRTGWRDRPTRIVLLCAALPVLTAISALLAAETARVWNFMYPLLMAPVGIELARQRLVQQLIVVTCLAVILAAICRNMSVFM